MLIFVIMQGISVIITFPERVLPSVPIQVAQSLFETVELLNSVPDIANNCHIEIADSLSVPFNKCYGTK